MTQINLLRQVKNLNFPEGFLINWQIVTSVSSWNLTVAIKTLAGTDPSVTDPVYCRIGWVVRSITSALYDTFPAWTNWRNAWSPELATKEIDYFVYLAITSSNTIVVAVSRIPNWINQNDFSASGTYSNEKYLMDYWTSFNVVNIWRFNAILSAWPGHTWSLPATSVIINRPIYETRWLDCSSVLSAEWSMTISNVEINHFKYKIVWNNLFYKNNIKMDFWWTTNNVFFETLPFWRKNLNQYDIAWIWFGYDNGDMVPSVIFESAISNKLRIIKMSSVYAIVNNANIRIQWNYEI